MSTAAGSEARRTDAWWVQPAAVAIGLTAFVLYSTFRTFENNLFLTEMHLAAAWRAGQVGHLLSPFYSPLIVVDWEVFGRKVSPAMLILIFPLSFRLTCYYYRKAYYRSFFLKPPACAVPGPNASKKYSGEMFWPMALQNLHRYAFYFAFIFIFILAYDVIKAMQYHDGWGVSIGTLVLLLNVVLLGGYTFGCHSWRHLIGGRLDCYSCDALSKTRYGMWRKATFLNERHALFAWLSLVWVAFTDFYVRSVCAGWFTDVVLFKVGGGG
ncbi:MAG: succinate dehydrogenase [Armatimonadota bacterium]